MSLTKRENLLTAIETAIKEDWEIVKNTAGKGSPESIFDLAYRFGWHAANKYARKEEPNEPDQTDDR